MASFDENLLKKFDLVGNIIKNKKAIVALSGGVDSTLVLLLSLKYAANVIPVFFNSPIFSKNEVETAGKLCSSLNIQLEILDLNPLTDPIFRSNPKDRCYYCKKDMMGSLIEIKKESDFDVVIEGTNFSEIKGHRPGYKALKELGVVSPLVDAEFLKIDVRNSLNQIKENHAVFFKNSNYEPAQLYSILSEIEVKPSNACLCSRIAYSVPVKKDILEKIDKAESFFRSNYGIKVIRVRYHKNNLIRIEMNESDFSKILDLHQFKLIRKYMHGLGFKYITFDLDGFRSGSMY